MCEEPNERLINFFIEKQKGGCGKKMESLTDYIIKITVIEKTDDLIKECKKLLQVGIENGANLIMLGLDLGVTKEKLLEYYDKNLIDYWEKEFKKIKSCIKEEEGEGE